VGERAAAWPLVDEEITVFFLDHPDAVPQPGDDGE